MSNVHAAPGHAVDGDELAAVVGHLLPGRPLVGDEQGEDLDAALAGGFTVTGACASGCSRRRTARAPDGQASASATSKTSSLTSSCAGAGSSRSDADHGRSVRSSRHHSTDVARIANAEAAE